MAPILPRQIQQVPKTAAGLPDGLCFSNRFQGQLAIMPVMLSRAERWVDNLYLGNAYKPMLTPKRRRAALVISEQKTREQLQQESPIKRKLKVNEHQAAVQDAIYWAAVEPEVVGTTEAFIQAMAVDSRKRTRIEESVIDSYWSQGMSLDPILKTETIGETYTYLKVGQRECWRSKDLQYRGVEVGDLDAIQAYGDCLISRAVKYRKMAPKKSIRIKLIIKDHSV